MSKKRRLTAIQRQAIHADQSRRERDPRPITLAGMKPAPVMNKDQRRHVINKVIDMMRPWNQTPFEHEGTIRHGLRSGLCLRGYGWARSDAEAVAIVAQALRLIGVPRPTWDEGQRHYADPRENCKWCYGPIAEEDMSGGRTRVFCSDHCARAAYVYWDMKNASKGSATEREAYRAVCREKVEVRECEQCGSGYKPRSEGRLSRFCSLSCAAVSRKRDIEPRPCANPDCGKTFTPESNNLEAQYCCAPCHSHHRTMMTFERRCETCGTMFAGGQPTARFCTPACRSLAYQVSIGRIKRVSPPVLDYLFRRQGLRITGERIAA